MSRSLRDQLLAAGLASKKQAKQADHAKRQQKTQQKKKQTGSNAKVMTPADMAREAAARKAERDRKLNEKREAQRKKRELAAQIRQLIESNRLERKDADLPYRFKLNKGIERIYVTEPMQRGLARGEMGIVRLANAFEVVPAEVARKVSERDPGALVQLLEPGNQEVDPDDPYAAYQVPDDLMW